MNLTTAEIIDIQAEIIKRQASMIRDMALQIDAIEAWDAEMKRIERLRMKLSEGKT